MELRAYRDYWLPKAKSLFVGQSVRDRLPADRGARGSLVIRNEESQWSVWCHRRNSGDRVQKQYIVRAAPSTSGRLDLPDDLVKVDDLPRYQKERIYGYLLGKGLFPNMLPELEYSDDRQRVVIRSECGKVLGRDLTDTHPSKWLVYGRTKHSYLGVVQEGTEVVIVEDPLSCFKLRYALPSERYSVVAALGTSIRNDLIYKLCGVPAVHIMMDGDSAGDRGAKRIQRSLFDVGRVVVHSIPRDKDPKDLFIEDLRSYFYAIQN